jgi:precorrin-2 methylase
VQALDRISDCMVVEWATQKNQRIRRLSEVVEETLPYFSTILVRGKADAA